MTCTTILTIYDFDHIDCVTASLELEAEIGVAYLARETDAVKPMRKYYRTYVLSIRIIIDDNVTVLGLGGIDDRKDSG